MKTAFIFTFFGVILLLILWIGFPIIVGVNTVDIHIHDTKLVIHSNQLFIRLSILLILFLGTLFTLGGTVGTRVRKKGFAFAFAVFFLLDFTCLLYMMRLFK